MDSRNIWNDDVIEGLRKSVSLFQTIVMERSQLYGALIKLMKDTNTTEYTLSKEDRERIGREDYILFSPTEDGETALVSLKKQEIKEDGDTNA